MKPKNIYSRKQKKLRKYLYQILICLNILKQTFANSDITFLSCFSERERRRKQKQQLRAKKKRDKQERRRKERERKKTQRQQKHHSHKSSTKTRKQVQTKQEHSNNKRTKQPVVPPAGQSVNHFHANLETGDKSQTHQTPSIPHKPTTTPKQQNKKRRPHHKKKRGRRSLVFDDHDIHHMQYHGNHCNHHLFDSCDWPQCNKYCPKFYNRISGQEMDFMEMLMQFGVDMSNMAQALDMDLNAMQRMDQSQLFQLLVNL